MAESASTAECSILVPYRPENEHRRRIGGWQWRYLSAVYPGVQIVRCDDGATDGPFNRSRALNRARQLATGRILWCLDVDCAPHRDDLGIALAALADHDWLIVYAEVLELDEVGTRYTLDGGSDPHKWNAHTRRGTAYGLPMITAALWDDIGGWDEDYTGWGYEDLAMHRALSAHPPVLPSPIRWIRTLQHPRDTTSRPTRLNAARYDTGR